PVFSYTSETTTTPPPALAPFTFRKSATHDIRLEYQAWNYFQKVENVNSLNAQVLMFWNLVDRTDPIGKVYCTATSANQYTANFIKAVAIAKTSDVIILAVGANWN